MDSFSFSRVLGAAWLALGLAACSPGLNWRQVPLEAGDLRLLLPCKPDRAQKTVPLGGSPTVLSMVGCEAEGMTFALSVADLADPAQATPVLAQWHTLTLSHMRAGAHTQASFKVHGAAAMPAPLRVSAHGHQADGQAIEGQALYFTRGSKVYQAVIYAPRIAPEAADTFLSSIQFQ